MKMNSFLLLLFFYLCVSASAHQWEKFHGLAGCRLGDMNPVIPELKKYLHHFGYLPNEHHDPSRFTEKFDEALHSALRTYQLNFNLKATGVLDTPTIGMLVTPRCGVPDIINGTTSMASGKLSGGRLHYSFFPGSPTWEPDLNLRYFVNYSTKTKGSISNDDVKQAMANAFRRWVQATTNEFNFREVTEGESSTAEIQIGFYSGDHGDGLQFDGPRGRLAHAFAPTDGRFHLDLDEDWQVDSSQWTPDSYDLESVCVHEIGHLLGLAHSSVPDAIMYPSLLPNTTRRELQYDDVDGIRVLYDLPPIIPPIGGEGGGDPNLHVAY